MTPPLEFRLSSDDPRAHTVARLRVVCPHHLDLVLFEHCMSADGGTWLNEVHGYRDEMVGVSLEPLSDRARSRAALLGLTLPVEHAAR